MSEAAISKRLQAHLNEVYFVFRQLPKQLTNVSKLLGVSRWRQVFMARATALRSHQERLHTALRTWGARPGPCQCDEVSEQLNELRYTAKSNKGASVVVERAARATRRLGSLVRERLHEALRLSRSIREEQLAQDLDKLIELERDSEEPLKPQA